MADGFDFSRFPTLTTERLVLRELSADDAADLFVWRSDPVVQRFNSEPMVEVAQAAALIEELRAEYAAGQAISWAVTERAEGRAIGLFGFVGWDRWHHRADVGYDLRRDRWGRGIAAEALAALLRFGFDELRLNRVEAQTIADNHESVRLLERLGFTLEGRRRSYSLEEDGTYHDGAVYGLLRGDSSRAERR